MAGLFIVAGIAMVDRHRQKRQAKEAKVVYDDIRYAALQEETRQRLAQSPISPVSSDAHTLRLLTTNDLAPVDMHLNEVAETRRPSRPTLKSRRSSWYDPRSWSEKKSRRTSKIDMTNWNYA